MENSLVLGVPILKHIMVVMFLSDADGMTISVYPDQTALGVHLLLRPVYPSI